MKTTPRITFPWTLFIFILLILTLIELLPKVIERHHDEPHDLVKQTHHFTYKVSTFTNIHNKRCALIRCGHQYANRLFHDSRCDIVFVEVLEANHNKSFNYCAIDYIHTQWDSLSRTYNDGFYYLANDVQLRLELDDLPLEEKAVHFSTTENDQHVSTAWFSVKPSHMVRRLFGDWYNSMNNPNVSTIRDMQPGMIALNHARTCRSPDVVCHTRVAVIAWQCNSVRNVMNCMSPSYSMIAIKLIITALTIVITFSTVIIMISKSLPRLRGLFGTPLNAHLVPIKLTHMLAFTCVCMFIGEDWIFIVKSLARICGVAFKHDLHLETFNAPADVFRAIPDLRGLYSGYAYVFRDNVQMVRITGPTVSIVVGLTSVVLYLKRVLYEGVLLKSLVTIATVRLACEVIVNVTGVGKVEATAEEDEYFKFRSDIPSEVNTPGLSKDRRSRSFIVGRDRGV